MLLMSILELIKTVVRDPSLPAIRIHPLVWHLRNEGRLRETQG